MIIDVMAGATSNATVSNERVVKELPPPRRRIDENNNEIPPTAAAAAVVANAPTGVVDDNDIGRIPRQMDDIIPALHDVRSASRDIVDLKPLTLEDGKW